MLFLFIKKKKIKIKYYVTAPEFMGNLLFNGDYTFWLELKPDTASVEIELNEW